MAHVPCVRFHTETVVFLERGRSKCDLLHFLFLKDQTVRVEIGAGARLGLAVSGGPPAQSICEVSDASFTPICSFLHGIHGCCHLRVSDSMAITGGYYLPLVSWSVVVNQYNRPLAGFFCDVQDAAVS